MLGGSSAVSRDRQSRRRWLAGLVALVALGGRSDLGVMAQSAHPDDPTGTPLYITEPSCGYYQCDVTWHKGDTVAVNWLNPVKGQVSVQLMSQIDGPTYTIVSSIPGTSQEGYCDSGYGKQVLAPGRVCGQVQFRVPDGWQELVNYTVVVTSLDDQSVAGYTDNVNIVPAAKGSDAGPSGTRVQLLTVPGPTSTNKDAGVENTGQVPSPTAVTDSKPAAPSTSSQPASSSAAVAAASSASSASSSADNLASSAGRPSRSSAASSRMSSAQTSGGSSAPVSAASGAVSPSASTTSPTSASGRIVILGTESAIAALVTAAVALYTLF